MDGTLVPVFAAFARARARFALRATCQLRFAFSKLTFPQLLVLSLKIILILAALMASPLVLPVVHVSTSVIVLNKVITLESISDNTPVLLVCHFVVDFGIRGLYVSTDVTVADCAKCTTRIARMLTFH